MEKIITGILGGIIAGLVYIVILAYGVFSWGYVLFMFYAWFLEPVYVDIPHITLNQAFGLTLVLGLFKNNIINKKYEGHTEIEVTSYWVSSLLYPWLTLLSGYIVYSYLY